MITSLRCTGLSIAIEKNLHRLISDEAWEASVINQPAATRIKNLIHREVSERIQIRWRRPVADQPS